VVTIRRERNLHRRISTAAVRLAVRRTLEDQAHRNDCSVSVMLAGEKTVTALNACYRGVPRATDVLSFAGKLVDPETKLRHLGDIVISLPRAARQAAARRKPLEGEVQLLAVHGTLHLLGHDHEKAGGKKRMWRAQARILKELARSA
jgi:probable rRNA maturation factor